MGLAHTLNYCAQSRPTGLKPSSMLESPSGALSVPGLVVMVKLGVCQHYSDLFEPNRPDQDDTSVPIVIGIPVQGMGSMQLDAAASSEC